MKFFQKTPLGAYKAPLNLLLVLMLTWLGWTQIVRAQQSALPVDRVVAAHYPPLMNEFDAESLGLAIEILQQAAQISGRQIKIQFLPFQRAVVETQARDDTLMPALFRNRKRETSFQWIGLIQTARMRFMTTQTMVSDLDVARHLSQIAVEGGTSTERFLTNVGFDNLFVTNDPSSSAQMLAAGRVDAWFLTQSLAEKIWRSGKLKPKLIVGEVIHTVPIYLVSGRDFPREIAAQYNLAIKQMHINGDIARIIDRYETIMN